VINTDFHLDDGSDSDKTDADPVAELDHLWDVFKSSKENASITSVLRGRETESGMGASPAGVVGHGKAGGTWFSSFVTLCHRTFLNNIRNVSSL
jgi:hypothetical protein